MLNSIAGDSLNQARLLRPTARSPVIQNHLTRKDDEHFYVFNLRHRSRLDIRLNQLQANADLELIQDRDRNGEVDLGEVVASSRASQRRSDSISIQGLDRGVYFLRVLLKGDASTRYNLFVNTTASTSVSPTYQIVKLTNNYRAEYGLPALALNTQLTQAAQRYAQVLAVEDHWSHTGPKGEAFYERIESADYAYSQSAENLAAGHTTAESALKGWIRSPGHRRNLLAYQVQEIGVGYFFLKQDDGRYRFQHYWSQSMATPGDKRVVPNVPEKPGGR